MRAERPTLQDVTRLLATLCPSPLCAPLHAASREIRRALALAFRVAATRGRAVTLSPGASAAPDQIPLRLPEEVGWGRPEAVPLPPTLSGSGWETGSPRPILVMPGGRALASVWFLHHGREALCLRLNLNGSLELLRYRPRLRAWTHC